MFGAHPNENQLTQWLLLLYYSKISSALRYLLLPLFTTKLLLFIILRILHKSRVECVTQNQMITLSSWNDDKCLLLFLLQQRKKKRRRQKFKYLREKQFKHLIHSLFSRIACNFGIVSLKNGIILNLE